MKNKNLIRKKLKEKRSSLSNHYCSAYEKSISKIVLSFIQKNNSLKIGLYVSFGNEVRTMELIEKILSLKKEVYLPVQNFINETLIFRQYTKDSELIKNQNKILEPKSGKEIDPEDLDIIFIPLLAFDKNLNRVGMGKGYYDKTLHGKKAGKLVGLAYDFQEISNAFPEDHDVAMNAIITSKNIFTHEKTY